MLLESVNSPLSVKCEPTSQFGIVIVSNPSPLKTWGISASPEKISMSQDRINLISRLFQKQVVIMLRQVDRPGAQ